MRAQVMALGGLIAVACHASPRPAAHAVPPPVDWFSGDGIFTVFEPPPVGAEFDVIDEQGLLDRVTVTGVTRDDPTCASYVVWRALTRGSGSVRSPVGETVAVRSLASLSRARVHNEVPDVIPVPQALYQRLGLDEDGDGKIDVVRDTYACPGAPTNMYCYDESRRDAHGAWLRVRHVQMARCDRWSTAARWRSTHRCARREPRG